MLANKFGLSKARRVTWFAARFCQVASKVVEPRQNKLNRDLMLWLQQHPTRSTLFEWLWVANIPKYKYYIRELSTAGLVLLVWIQLLHYIFFSLVKPNLVTSRRPLFNDYILNGYTYFIAHWPSEQSQLLTHNLLSPFYDELLVEKIMTYIGDTCKLLLMQKARSCISTVEWPAWPDIILKVAKYLPKVAQSVDTAFCA